VAVTLPRFSAVRYQIIANFSLGPEAEMAFAMGGNYLVADLGLKYRIIVTKLRPQPDREAYNL
jgi:hypothetical protein